MQGFYLITIEVIDRCHGLHVVHILIRGIHHLDGIRHHIPLYMTRFAGFLGSIVGACGVIIVVESLPHAWRECRHAHPDECTWSIVAHLVVPCLVDAFHVFKVDILRFVAKLLQRVRSAVTVVDAVTVIQRSGVASTCTVEVMIPYVVVEFR